MDLTTIITDAEKVIADVQSRDWVAMFEDTVTLLHDIVSALKVQGKRKYLSSPAGFANIDGAAEALKQEIALPNINLQTLLQIVMWILSLLHRQPVPA